jgi:pyridoxamine 5'-phosphate oxidase-like protein
MARIRRTARKPASRQKTVSQPKATRPHIPGYGLPKSKKGLLPWKWAEDRLKKSKQYWIATARSDGRPHVMIVWALWMKPLLYFSTGKQSIKARNLARNPNCVMCTERAAEGVILEGLVETERDVARIREFIRLYEKKYKWKLGEMAEKMLSLEDPVYFLRPKVGFGLWEKRFATTATRWLFN